MRRPRHALAVVSLGVLGACASSKKGGPPAPVVEPVVVVFSNQAGDQATVYARRSGGDAQRLGDVPPNSTATLKIPSTIVRDGTVTIIARLLARSVTPSSGQIQIRSGERIAVTLPPAMNVLTVLPASDP